MSVGFYRDFQPEDLPVPGRQIMQLIQYTLDEDVQVETLSKLISVNPSLTAQLLGLVNSAFFGFRRRISTIADAVITLGLSSLKDLVLCFAVKEALSKKKIPGFDLDAFWEDSIRRGVAAKQLGYLIDGSTEEAFTAGMLQDIGLLVLFLIEPDKTDRWSLLRSNLPDKRYEMEQQLFHTTHDHVGSLLAKKWNLPDAYIIALGYHHTLVLNGGKRVRKTDDKQYNLAGVMYLSDWCNAVYTGHDKNQALKKLKTAAKKLFKLSEDQVELMLSILPDQVKETSSALNISASEQVDFNTVMDQANRKLLEDNISYQELTWQLQHSLKQRDEYAAKLEAELDVAREIQQSLQPDIKDIPQVCAFNIPALHLSGDFYDYFSKSDGTICFCLGDVSGKGTSAALLMAKAISLFRCLCKVVDDISTIVELMNNELCETAVRGMFVTFVAGWLNPVTQHLNMINVGHLPPFLVHGRNITKIDASDPPLGVLAGTTYPSKQFLLADSRLYIYTDGFTEGKFKDPGQDLPEDAELGLKGFLRWIVQSGNMPIKEQMAWIKHECETKLKPKADDLTLMILSGP